MVTLTDFLLVFGIWGLGVLLAKKIARDIPGFDAISVGFPIGLACLTFVLFLLSWAGLPFAPITVAVTLGGLLIVALLLTKLKFSVDWRFWFGGISIRRWLTSVDFWGWLIFLAFSFYYTIVTIALSYGGWDSASIWSIKGYGMAYEGTIFAARNYGELGLSYPLNIQIGIGLFSFNGHDTLPISKILFALLFLSLLVAIRQFLSRLNVKPILAWLAVSLIVSTPYILEYSLRGYANIPYAVYVVAGVLWVATGLSKSNTRQVLLGAILLAFSVWTRVEGIQFWAILFLIILIFGSRSVHRWGMILALVLPVVIIYLPWSIFLKVNPSPTIVSSLFSVALERVWTASIDWSALYKIIKFILWRTVKSDRIWGLFIPVGALYSGLAFFVRKAFRNDVLFRIPFFCALGYGLGVVFMYYITSFDESQPLDSWLGTGTDRMLLPGMILLGVFAAMVISRQIADNGIFGSGSVH